MTDFDASDIAAMRKQGDLREFLRQQMRPRAEQPAKPAPRRPPGHRPGAWPTGTSPPGPTPELPAAEWEAALEEYRVWLASGARRDRAGPLCGCRACQTNQDPRSQP